MEMDALEIKTPGELVMWLAMTESEISMNQSGAEIILDYLHEHEFSLAVHKQKLMVRNTAEAFSEYQPYSIDHAIHDVCEWNLELIDNMEDGMKNPGSQEEYLRFSEAHDILKEQEKVLDGLWRQTKYEQLAKDIALQVIVDTLGKVPEGLEEKIQAYGIKEADRMGDGRQADGRREQERMR